MRLLVIANARIPSEKAHPLQIVHMAAAFAGRGHQVEVLYARRANTDAMRRVGDPYAYFGVPRNFRLIGLPCVDFVKRVTLDWPALKVGGIARAAHLVQLWTFALAVLLFVRRRQADTVYSRDLLPLLLVRRFAARGRQFVFEAHTTPRSVLAQRLHLWAVRRIDRVVVIGDALRRWYLANGLAPERVYVARDGVDLAAFATRTRAEARQALGIESATPVVAYIGHLYPWKGVDGLVEAAALLAPDTRVFIVGGVPPDLDRIRAAARTAPNLTVTGHLPPAEARAYLAACDVAVIPLSGRSLLAREHTSPLKLFEYMAAGRAIVASDLPSLREVLIDGQNCVLVTPDDPAALAAGIRRVLADRPLAERLGRAARADVEPYTWSERAGSIAAFLALP
ncbi:MAG: glycosyltransferase family 4 protein [Actinobacteria bacterium]|nr:glycosyltransferase family 4 protein [Actinomycetota bacterium]